MPPSDETPVRRRLRALRVRAGLSAPKLAERLGKPHSTYKSYEDRYKKKHLPMDLAQLLAKALSGLGEPPITRAEVLSLASTPAGEAVLPDSNVRPASDAPTLPDRHEMPKDVPVWGTAAGANGDGAFLLNALDGAIDYVRRPPALAAARDVFAIYVESDSMAPRFEPGELVYCDPRRPVVPGRYVVLTVQSEDPGEPPRSYVKRLVRRTASEVILEQFNPPKELRFAANRVSQMVRVLDWPEVLGI
jgi:phage repressor protein C with HTH and peptisase S24 domain